ncbi:unnamed protein product [Closterium sp. Naga37s-1]|nr:unnamed protein product [Closterium sp. Naga37s-1]
MATAASSNLHLRFVWKFLVVAFTLILSGTSLAVASHDKRGGTVGTTSGHDAVSDAASNAMGTQSLVFRHRSLLSSTPPEPLPVEPPASLQTATILLSSTSPQPLPLPVDPLDSLPTATSFGGGGEMSPPPPPPSPPSGGCCS